MGARLKGSESWYSPTRDVLECWPSCIVKGAAFVLDRNSEMYAQLLKQPGLSADNAYDKVKQCMLTCLEVLEECRSADISEVLTAERIGDTGVYFVLMSSAACVMFRLFNTGFREAHLTFLSGRGTSDPVGHIDTIYALREFAKLVNEVNGDYK